MKTFTIGQMARESGLSRSALLYYDSLGLLPPARRAANGYRRYSEKDLGRLREICSYRDTGMPLEEIRKLLSQREKSALQKFLLRRMEAINKEIAALRLQQKAVASMLRGDPALRKVIADRHVFVETLEKSGLDKAARLRLHQEFEKNAPAAHNDFLTFLGFSPEEIKKIRELSAKT